MPRRPIEYKGPWGGVNTSVPETYLQPNEFPLLDNIFIYGNELKTRPLLVQVANNTGTLHLKYGTLGYLNPNGQSGLFEPFVFVLGRDSNSGLGSVFDIGTGNTGAIALPASATNGDMLGFPVFYNVMFQQATYWSGARKYFSYTFNPGGSNIYAVANANYGGVYVAELAEHILIGNVLNNNGDGANSPTLLIWSGSNNPTVFNPATDSTAGNQTLGRVYCVNGLVSNGYSAYLSHPQGLLQITPTGNATAPFNIQSILQSNTFGFGNMYAHSFAGRGDFSFFVSSDDVKMLTPYGLQGIGGNARNSIFADLANFGVAGFDPLFGLDALNVVGSVIPGFGAKYPYPNYVLAIPDGLTGTFLWIYLLSEDKWIRWHITNAIIGSFGTIPIGIQNTPSIQELAWTLFGSATAATGMVFSGTSFNTEASSEIDFRTEDQDGRFFQCARIRVTYRDLGVCPVTFSLYNVNEDGTYNNPAVSKVINLGTAAADSHIKQVYTDFVATGLFTQLKITRAANAGACSIIKVQLLEEGAENLEVV